MTLTPRERLTAAGRLIKVATGEWWGDGDVVTDVGIGYSDRGDVDTVWALGDWNERQRRNGDNVIPATMPPRLASALERLGVECEWHDMWDKCSHCARLVETTPPYHGWKPFYVELPDGDTLCGECALTPDWQDEIMATYVNNATRVITWCDESHLVDNGWTRYNPDAYESGHHPGMDADPATVLASVRQNLPDHDVVFWLDESSQFYIRWSAFTRPADADDDSDDSL